MNITDKDFKQPFRYAQRAKGNTGRELREIRKMLYEQIGNINKEIEIIKRKQKI